MNRTQTENFSLFEPDHPAVSAVLAKPQLINLAAKFATHGHHLYLVGGSVRDALMGRPVHDYDCTTDARPAETLAILQQVTSTVWETGIAFGTISAQVDGLDIEITTFRSDLYDGDTRNPEVTFGDTLEEDLVRRDFTCNAMAMEILPEGKLQFCDPLDGLSALKAGVLDTPQAPNISFTDDPLRMLRAARFVSQLSFSCAPRVEAALVEQCQQLKRITKERINAELNGLMRGQNPVAGIELMVESGLAEVCLPELPRLKLAPDEHLRHKDVYAHSLQVLENVIALEDPAAEPDTVLRWAALLHDTGKPDTRAAKPGGGVSFHHHEVVGAQLMRKRLKELKFSKQEIKDISGLIFLHMRFFGYKEGAWTDSAVRRYVADAGDLLPRLQKLVRADCTSRNVRKVARLSRAMDQLEERIVALQEAEDLAAIRPALDGNQIMQLLGLRPGPEVGQAWAFLKELRLERGEMTAAEAETELRKWAAENLRQN